jgi:hypothetical protein
MVESSCTSAPGTSLRTAAGSVAGSRDASISRMSFRPASRRSRVYARPTLPTPRSMASSRVVAAHEAARSICLAGSLAPHATTSESRAHHDQLDRRVLRAPPSEFDMVVPVALAVQPAPASACSRSSRLSFTHARNVHMHSRTARDRRALMVEPGLGSPDPSSGTTELRELPLRDRRGRMGRMTKMLLPAPGSLPQRPEKRGSSSRGRSRPGRAFPSVR